MTYEDAVQTIPCGRYRHFKGNEYEERVRRILTREEWEREYGL